MTIRVMVVTMNMMLMRLRCIFHHISCDLTDIWMDEADLCYLILTEFDKDSANDQLQP